MRSNIPTKPKAKKELPPASTEEFPLKSLLSKDKKVSGVVLSDHVRSLDWKARNVTFLCKAKSSVLNNVQTKLRLIIEAK